MTAPCPRPSAGRSIGVNFGFCHMPLANVAIGPGVTVMGPWGAAAHLDMFHVTALCMTGARQALSRIETALSHRARRWSGEGLPFRAVDPAKALRRGFALHVFGRGVANDPAGHALAWSAEPPKQIGDHSVRPGRHFLPGLVATAAAKAESGSRRAPVDARGGSFSGHLLRADDGLVRDRMAVRADGMRATFFRREPRRRCS
jgi:hypothetical protein